MTLPDETNLTTFQLRSSNAAIYPLYVSTPMLGRERLRSRNSLEVLALLPRYDADAQGGDDISDAEHTHLRRLLVWRALWIVLAALFPQDDDDVAEINIHATEVDDQFAYVGEQILFGAMRRVFMVPLLYIAGPRHNTLARTDLLLVTNTVIHSHTVAPTHTRAHALICS